MVLEVFINMIKDRTIPQAIYDRFFAEIKSREQQYIDSLTERINLLETQFNVVKLAVKMFESLELAGKKWRDEVETLKIIKRFLYIGKNDTLKIILSRANSLIATIEVKKAELEKMLPSGKDSKQADEDYFDHLIIQIAKYMQFYVDKRIVTVSLFATMIKDLRDHIEKSEQEKIKKDVSRSVTR